jgi:hypothetical protein
MTALIRGIAFLAGFVEAKKRDGVNYIPEASE